MTRTELRKNTYGVIAVYTCTIIAGVLLKIAFPAKDDPAYSTFKDLIPLILAIPAAYLAFCFNRRNVHIQALRSLWSNIIKAIQGAREFTQAETRTRSDYSKALSALSIVIDEVRGVFNNVGERNGEIGLYPFEALKEIHDAVRDLGFEDLATQTKAEITLTYIDQRWKVLRNRFLSEFERNEPDHPESKYLGR